MDKIINKNPFAKMNNVASRAFLLDLTNNLCIMYKEGDKYYFIHRSFQEYFAALYFASDYDENLKKVGDFFEKAAHHTNDDKTFDMLYDMIQEKLERYIFLPYLDSLMSKCRESYWEFFEMCYTAVHYNRISENLAYLRCETESFLYGKILPWHKLKVGTVTTISNTDIFEQFERDCADEFKRNAGADNVALYDNADFRSVRNIPLLIQGTENKSSLLLYFKTSFIRRLPEKFTYFRKFLESPEFPIRKEYENIKNYYHKLKIDIAKEQESDELFDD